MPENDTPDRPHKHTPFTPKNSLKTKKRQPLADSWFGVLLVSIGVLFLLNNFGIVPWSVWGQLWRLWPMILILGGVRLLLGSTWVANIIVTLITLAVCGSIFVLVLVASSTYGETIKQNLPWVPTNFWNQFSLGNQEQNIMIVVSPEDYPDVKNRTVDISAGGQKIVLSDTTEDDLFALSGIYYHPSWKPTVKTTQENQDVSIVVDTTQNGPNVFWGALVPSSYTLTLGQPDLTTDLIFSLGSGTATVDLQYMMINQLVIDMGSGSFELTLDELAIPTEKSSITIGSGSFTLRLPEEIGVSIEHAIGSGVLTIDGTQIDDDGTYTTSNYKSAKTTIDLSLKMGSGKVSILRD